MHDDVCRILEIYSKLVYKIQWLMRYGIFKRISNGFIAEYRASYTINAFRSNFEFDKDPNGVDASGNFFNKTIMSNINLVEQFNL
jgi:hypothetical protein